MNEIYRVPKRQFPAEVTLAGQPPVRLTLFLAGQAAHHAGYERPSDLLAGGDAFLPAMDGNGRLVLLQRDAVMVLSVPAATEAGEDPDPSGTVVDPAGSPIHPAGTPDSPMRRVSVRVTLENGRAIEGSVDYVMPEGHDRLQDFLNSSGRFLALRQGDTVHLIHKLRIASIAAT